VHQTLLSQTKRGTKNTVVIKKLYSYKTNCLVASSGTVILVIIVIRNGYIVSHGRSIISELGGIVIHCGAV
jgi:hypothetical protein